MWRGRAHSGWKNAHSSGNDGWRQNNCCSVNRRAVHRLKGTTSQPGAATARRYHATRGPTCGNFQDHWALVQARGARRGQQGVALTKSTANYTICDSCVMAANSWRMANTEGNSARKLIAETEGQLVFKLRSSELDGDPQGQPHENPGQGIPKTRFKKTRSSASIMMTLEKGCTFFCLQLEASCLQMGLFYLQLTSFSFFTVTIRKLSRLQC